MEETKRYGFLENEDEQQPNAPHLKSIKNLDLFIYDETEFAWNHLGKLGHTDFNWLEPWSSISMNIPHPPPEQA